MLGLMQTMAQPQVDHQETAKTTGNGFASLFTSLVESSQEDEVSEYNLASNVLGEVANLVSFLQLDDLEAVEGGEQLVGQATLSHSTQDLLEIMMRYLGMTNDEWETLLKKVANSVQDIAIDRDDANSQMHELLQLLTFLAQLIPEQLIQVVDNDTTNVVKAGKLLDLLLGHQDLYEGPNNKQREQLTNELKQLADKLATLLQANKQSSRQNYLQKTFGTFKIDSTKLPPNQTGNETGQTNSFPTEVPRTEGVTNQLFQFQQVPKVEQLTLMVENNGRSVTPEQLMKQFNSILAKSQFLKEGGTQKLFIKLHPEHLGAMRIELIQKNQMMVARILTTTAMAREMLDSQLHSLKQAFANQNIQVERIEISQQLSQQDRFLQKDNEAGQQHHQRGETKKDEQEDRATFEDTFEDVLLNVEV